ncbi:TPA: hypothetical protein DCP76_03605 [Patescibacteria group bacterium]|nr:hypothetical protein [Patescibacteria group bacterium]
MEMEKRLLVQMAVYLLDQHVIQMVATNHVVHKSHVHAPPHVLQEHLLHIQAHYVQRAMQVVLNQTNVPHVQIREGLATTQRQIHPSFNPMDQHQVLFLSA